MNNHNRTPYWSRDVREQFTVAVPHERRISGRLYDVSSGVCMGLASDEDKKKYPVNQPFNRNISGCPHKLVIHP